MRGCGIKARVRPRGVYTSQWWRRGQLLCLQVCLTFKSNLRLAVLLPVLACWLPRPDERYERALYSSTELTDG